MITNETDFRVTAFNKGKTHLVTIIENDSLTFDTFSEHVNEIESYIHYLKTIVALPKSTIIRDSDLLESAKTKSIVPTTIHPKEVTSIPNESAKHQNAHTEKSGVFQRNLAGGVVKGEYFNDGVAFIAESWVREHNLTDGDIVEVLGYDRNTNAAMGVRLEKVAEPEYVQDRLDFKYGIVEDTYAFGYDGDESLNMNRPFIVRKNSLGETLDESYRLTEEEINKLNIKAGDIVDLAWYKNSLHTRKLIWKHDTDEVQETISSRIKNNKTESESKQDDSVNDDLDDSIFNGYTICLLGVEPYKQKFEEAVEKRGGTFIFVDPKWGRKRREAEFKKSDIVMLGLSGCTHESTNHAVAFAKEKNINYGRFDGVGTGPFILQIMNKLKLF